MIKYRMMFSKEDPVRYISHLDLSKLFQRAFRRARLPVAYSEGFNPHPKISLASALRLGTTSTGEYLDAEFSEAVDREVIQEKLQAVLPKGIKVLSVQSIPKEAPSAMALINAAAYRLACKKSGKRISGQQIISELMGTDEIMIVRDTKKGTREINLRALIHKASVIHEDANTVVVDLLLAASDQGTGKPEEVGNILVRKGLCTQMENILVHRTGLFRLYPDGALRTPLQVLNRNSLVKPDQPAE